MFYISRADIRAEKGDPDRALADFDQAIKIDPKDDEAYSARGRFHLNANRLPQALADLNQASELDAKDAYTALWLDIVNSHSGLSSRLADATSKIDMTKWPAPVVRLFLGQLPLDAVLAAAEDPDANTKKGRVCQANFYGGELALRQGKNDEAKRLLRVAAAHCPHGYSERKGAVAELKTIRTGP